VTEERVTLRLALLSAATFLVGTNGFVIAGLLPDIAEGLGTTANGVGLSITVYAAVVAVLAPTVATFLVRVPRTALIAIGLVITGVGIALTAVADDLPIFALGRAVAGVGGAGIVPTAVAAAASMVPPARRARAIAVVTLGFTFSTAIGSPLGTAVAHVGGWRLALAAVAGLALLLAVVVAVTVRRIPLPPPMSLARRASVLAVPGILLALGSTVLTITAFNIAYIYSSTFTAQATGGSGVLFAGLLLAYGTGGIVGNQLAGRLTDRYGSRIVGSVLMAVHLLALAVMPLAEPSYVALAIVFVVWGVAAFGTGIAVQDRLAAIDPSRAAVSISWYSTGVYVGIALAPILGGWALSGWGASQVPHAAALAVLGAVVFFQLGFLTPRAPRHEFARGPTL
jgi:DHA1 family inner membrane transport protein